MSLVSIIFIAIAFLREIVFANYFGVTYEVDAYAVASQIPEIIFFIVCQSVNAIVIPLYSKLLYNESLSCANRVLSNFISVVFVGLLCVTLLFIAFAHVFIYIFAPGLQEATHQLAVSLVRWTVPISIVDVFIAVYISILNINNIFVRPKLISGLRFLIMIVSILTFSKYFGIYSVVWGMSCGIIIELLLYVFISRPYFTYNFFIDLHDPNILKASKQALPVIISSGVTELNLIIDRIISSFLVTGSIASLSYASKVSNIIYVIFINNLIVICYPRFAELASKKQTDKLIAFFVQTIRYAILVCLPVIAGGILFKKEIITIIFVRGMFHVSAIDNISNIFAYYLTTTIFAAIYILSSKIFIVYEKTMTVMYVAVLGVFINFMLNILLVQYYDVVGLAMATCISTIIVSFCMLIIIEKTFSHKIIIKLMPLIVKSLVSVTIVSFVIVFLRYIYIDIFNYVTNVHMFVFLLISFIGGIVAYIILLFLLRVEDIYTFKNCEWFRNLK